MVKKYGLEISQPGLEPNNGLTWEMTKRRGDREAHKYSFYFHTQSVPLIQGHLFHYRARNRSAMLWNQFSPFLMSGLINRDTEEKPGWCSDPHLPPCAA